MEAAALFAVAGLGYMITRLTGKQTENFQDEPATASVPSKQAPLTTSARGALQELDLRYQDLMSANVPRSEPNPGIQGTLLNYAPPQPKLVPMNQI